MKNAYTYDSDSINDVLCTTKAEELDQVDTTKVLGGNANYEVRACFGVTLAGEPESRYGVFNTNTGVQEATCSHLVTALSYANELKIALDKWIEKEFRADDSLPGLH